MNALIYIGSGVIFLGFMAMLFILPASTSYRAQQDQLLELIDRHSPDPGVYAYFCAMLLDRDPNEVVTEINNLRLDGLIEVISGVSLTGEDFGTACQYIITDKGRARIKQRTAVTV